MKKLAGHTSVDSHATNDVVRLTPPGEYKLTILE